MTRRIQLGDDLKARLKEIKRRKHDTITLVRVRSLAELDYHPDDENAEDDHTLYERTPESGLHKIFVKTMNDSRRIYVDHKPDYRDGSASIGISEMQEQQMDEQHDEEDCEYYDFDDASGLFDDYEIYKEVER